MDIKPIETEYKGYKFRSRLEARWAVFFDAIGSKWKYEAEGYEIEGVRYLPDFEIENEDNKFFIEIKPNFITEEEERKAELLSIAYGGIVAIFKNDPFEIINNPESAIVYLSDGTTATASRNLIYLLVGALKPSSYIELVDCIDICDKAKAKARQARFEFGETPHA